MSAANRPATYARNPKTAAIRIAAAAIALAFAGCDGDRSETTPAADAGEQGKLHEKLLGSWTRQADDNNKGGDVWTVTRDGYTTTSPDGSPPARGKYTVVSANGKTLKIKPQMELEPGKYLPPGANHVIEFVDDDTIDKRTEGTKFGGRYTRSK